MFSRKFRSIAQYSIAVCALLFSPQLFASADVVVHLKNGDRLSGALVSEDTNRLVLAVRVLGEVNVPRAAIARTETPSKMPAASVAPKTPPVKSVTTAKANAAPAAPPAKRWKANVNLGSDLLFSDHDREVYYSRIKISYEEPFESDPEMSFRTLLDYNVEYGKTDGVTSSDRMGGSLKADLDVKGPMFMYTLAGGGYDHARRINAQYEAGPGAGYHLFNKPTFRLNAETGLHYQAEDRDDDTDVSDMYFRLAHNLSWKIAPRLSLAHAVELFPKADDFEKYRTRVDTTLSIGVTKGLSLNLTLLDLYDTNPANRVNNNELQVRSSLGVTF